MLVSAVPNVIDHSILSRLFTVSETIVWPDSKLAPLCMGQTLQGPDLQWPHSSGDTPVVARL